MEDKEGKVLHRIEWDQARKPRCVRPNLRGELGRESLRAGSHGKKRRFLLPGSIK